MMTHRGLQNKRDRVLRYLDLCIDGRQQNDGNVPRNTPRDQSGTKGKPVALTLITIIVSISGFDLSLHHTHY